MLLILYSFEYYLNYEINNTGSLCNRPLIIATKFNILKQFSSHKSTTICS